MHNIKYFAVFCAIISLMLSCTNAGKQESSSVTQNIAFNLPEDFELETLYHPSAANQGSWVALAEDSKSQIYACDQNGKIYRFEIPAIGSVLDSTQVTPLNLEIGEAHGMIWAFNSLYVAVNKNWDDELPDDKERGSGIYRLTDSNADGSLDHIQMLLQLEGAGEHGPHSFVLSPDEKSLYFIAGNHTLLPTSIKEHSRLPNNWGEDNLFPPYLDARGHANDIKAPGGWIVQFDPEGDNWELISAGYRNPFDLAFNKDGELFTYDADMEWDIGMPWYRPTRICHVTSGSEYGWRTGSGKWPDYYPDNLPAVHNLEQGSPTAVLAATNLNLPARYKNGLLVMDWSFGTVYFIDLQAEGSSYTAKREEFFSGTPLPLTDMIAGSDGHLYFATGGRGLDSHLYRLRYTGSEKNNITQEKDKETEALRDIRHQLEKFHNNTAQEAIPMAWKYLDHPDRFIRYAARIALEHQPTAHWVAHFYQEEKPQKLIEAGLALARQGDKKMQPRILNTFNKLDRSVMTTSQHLDLLRAYSLVFIRMGAPDALRRQATINALKSHFPNNSNALTRELAQLLLYLNADGIVDKLSELLDKHTKEKTLTNEGMLSEEITYRSDQYGPLIREVIDKMPPSEAIYYGILLSHAKTGWTKELREKYFLWFYDVLSAKGGMSFKACMENVRLQAMSHVPKDQLAHFQELSGVYSPATIMADLPQPIGPGGNYDGKAVGKMLWGGALDNYSGTPADGERAYQAGLCILCHRMKGEGGATGPDLTQIHTKFNAYDLLYAIYSPNDDISDQYAFTLFHLKDDKKIAGRIYDEKGDSIRIMPNPLNTSYTVSLAKEEVLKRELSPISPMPSGLLNRLNPKEIADLFVYMLSAGDPSHELYGGNKKTK